MYSSTVLYTYTDVIQTVHIDRSIDLLSTQTNLTKHVNTVLGTWVH